MYTILYFSATGNTKYLVDYVSTKIDVDTVFQIDKTQYEELTPNQHLIIMYPIHGFNPPSNVVKYIKDMPKWLYNEVSLIAVGCNELFLNDAVSKSLRKFFLKNDIEIIIDIVVPMPITIVLNMKDDVKDSIVEVAKERLNHALKDLMERKTVYKKPGIPSRLIHMIGKLEDPAARLFGLELHANKNCTSCGICWKNCPADNIKEGKKQKPKFGFSCTMCMRCIYSCPEKAISPYISKFITVKGGYKLK